MSTLTVRVTPRGGRDAIEGFLEDGTLSVRVAAAPADGAANDAVVRLLARALGIPPRDVALEAGLASRRKRIEVPLTIEAVRARLGGCT